MGEQKKKIRGGELVVKCLHEESVTTIFGITGGQLITIVAIYDYNFKDQISFLI